MLLVENSSGEDITDTLNKNTMHFFQSSSPFNEQVMFNYLFDQNKLSVSVTPEVATILFHGFFFG